MKVTNHVRMVLPAEVGNEGFARAAVAAFCAPLCPTVEQINDIKTAVSEAVNNCVVHAYSGQDGAIDVEVSLYERSVQICIRDYGCGFDNITEAMQPFYTSKPNEERSGMGFTLMQAFMNEVEVVSHKGEGTTVVMRKQIAC